MSQILNALAAWENQNPAYAAFKQQTKTHAGNILAFDV